MSTQRKASRNRPLKEVAYGNLDKDKNYPITQDAIDKGMYVILSYKTHTEPDPNNTNKVIDTGDIDSNSKRIGIFTPGVYEEYTRENEKEGKVNTFNRMLGKYIVLHDPTLESKEGDNAGNDDDLSKLSKAQLTDMALGFNLSEDDAKAVKTANKETLVGLITKYKNK